MFQHVYLSCIAIVMLACIIRHVFLSFSHLILFSDLGFCMASCSYIYIYI